MTEESLLRIGPFSRASSLSVKALRTYHESGLLVPAAIDPETGYRSYSVAQLIDAAIIRRLRQLDLSLDAIAEVIAAHDPATTRKVLTEHGTVLEARLAATQHAIDDLQVAVERPTLHTPVHRRYQPPATALTRTQTVSEAHWSQFLDRARDLLVSAAGTSGAVIEGAFGACYPTLENDDAQEVVTFVCVRAAPLLPAELGLVGIRIGELPGTQVAVLAHRGGYDDLDNSYRQLGAWVAENAVPTDLPVRELYLIGSADTDDPSEFQTEICWPIE